MTTADEPLPARNAGHTARYDIDPHALAWARAKIQHQLDRLAKFEKRASQIGGTELAAGLSMARRSTAELLLGGHGCVVGAFDERRPVMFGGASAEPPAPETHVVDYQEPTAAPYCIDDCPGCKREQKHDDQVRANALRQAADALEAHRCAQTGTTPGVKLPCDHRPADLLRARADEISRQGAQTDGEQA